MDHTAHEGPERGSAQPAAPAAPAGATAAAAPVADPHATGADAAGERAQGWFSHTTDGSAASDAAGRAQAPVPAPESGGEAAPGAATAGGAPLWAAGHGANGGLPNKEIHAEPVQPASSSADPAAAPTATAAAQQAGCLLYTSPSPRDS